MESGLQLIEAIDVTGVLLVTQVQPGLHQILVLSMMLLPIIAIPS